MSFTSIGSCQELAWTLTGHQHGDKIINLNLGICTCIHGHLWHPMFVLWVWGVTGGEAAFDWLMPGASLDTYQPPTWGQNYQFEHTEGFNMRFFIYYKKNSEIFFFIYISIYGQHCLVLQLFDQKSNKEILIVKLLSKVV